MAHAREVVKEVPEIAEFAFVDVNCRVGIKTIEGEFKFLRHCGLCCLFGR